MVLESMTATDATDENEEEDETEELVVEQDPFDDLLSGKGCSSLMSVGWAIAVDTGMGTCPMGPTIGAC
jgi:hypothetical protein